MTTVTLAHTPDDDSLAAQLKTNLEAAGIALSDILQPGDQSLLLVILSTQTAAAPAVVQPIITALDNHQHIIAIQTASAPLPKLIDHLQPIDFQQAYDSQTVLDQIAYLTGPDAPKPITTLTPATRAANKRTALIIIGLGSLTFIMAILFIAVWGYGPPEGEFAGVETKVILTRDYFVDEALPISTEDALEFQATYDNAMPSLQPILAATATAIHEDIVATLAPRSTDQATQFAVTLQEVSTVIQDSLRASATAAAGD